MDRRTNHLAALFVDTVLDFLRYEEDRERIAAVLSDYGLHPLTIDRILVQQQRRLGSNTQERSNLRTESAPPHYPSHP